ncbi:MAG TPA: efflux RND transporter permease subunit [Steroidobacteraceae bacterium]|nr:efflux RND transporter permease subunit [Steroidobacteraceae bacterium]
MNFVTWAIRNPIPAVVLFAALLVAGIVGFVKLGVQDQPDIDFPAVTVTIGYPGAPPSQMESEVTRKIEDTVATVVGIEHITSTINEGTSSTRIEFHFERNVNEALEDVRAAVTRVRSDLPQNINEPIVSRVTVAGQPVITFGVASSSMSDEELSWFVDLNVMRAITAVEGVGQVNRVGGVNREIRITLDPDRMAAMGASAGNVSQQLRIFQAEYPGGEARLGSGEQNVRTVGTMKSAQELAALPIALPDGRSVRLDDIATVRDQAAEIRSMALLDGRPVVGFEITRAWGAGALGVADDVRKAVAELQQQNPQVHFSELNSRVENIRDSFHASMKMLIEGSLLTIIVVWLFLRDWRATTISAVALPLAIIPTFWAMSLLHYSLNTLTLLALSLVVGVLVDDAIVEVENNVRHLAMGKAPLQAATDAAIEIGLAVIATTFTLCAVFVPVAFMSGVTGEFFRPFGFTVTVAVLFSLLVARMLTPMMAAYFMKPYGHSTGDGPLKSWYLDAVRYCLAHRRLTLGVATVIFFGSLALGATLPRTFRAAQDQGYSMLQIELPPGAAIEQTRDAAEQARLVLQGMPEVAHVYTTIGTSTVAGFGGGTVGQVRRATLTIDLKPKDQRKLTQPQFEGKATKALRVVPGIHTSFMNFAGGKLQITLVGDDSDTLTRAANAVERELRTIPGLGGVTSSASLLQPEIVIRPLPERAAELGVSTEALSTVTRIATSGDVDQVLAKLNLPARQIPIRVRLADKVRGDLERIRSLYVPAASGPVQLMNVADVSLGAGPAEIDRFDRDRNVTVEADLNGIPLGEMMAKAQQLPSLQHLPTGVRQVQSGDAQWIAELFLGFFAAMAVGILCIYGVLVILFHEFVQPLTILSALPPSIGGALLGLFVLHTALSISTLIGMLMLMGIVTKNSILLVEYAEKARRVHGMKREEALLDACSKRVRPIVMTTVAMCAGMLPVALGWSGDPSFRAPMGVTVLCGLIASTALSLFVVPVIFTLMDDFQQHVGGIPGRIRTRILGWLARPRSDTAG